MSAWIDLTHPIEESMSTLNGRCGFHKEIKKTHKEGCLVMQYKMHGGIGTHMDAPLHFFENGLDVCDLPVEMCIAPLYVLDISKTAHKDTLISLEEITNFEKKYKVSLENSIFVANTGWAKKWNTVEYRNEDKEGKMHFPGFTKKAAEHLVKNGVFGIGIDTLTPDGTNLGFPVHEVVLGSGRYILENIANLDLLPPVGSSGIVLPMKVKQGPEAPVRMIAKIN